MRKKFNADRMFQATALLPRLLDDGLALKEHRVLQVLGASMDHRDGPDPLTIKDTCWPSLEAIVAESLFSDRAVRYALDNLIAKGYLTKSKIPGKKLRKGKSQNKYENNRYHLVPEVWDSVGSVFDKRSAVTESDPATKLPANDIDAATAAQAKELSVLLYDRLGLSDQWANNGKQWLSIFAGLLKSFLKSDLVEMIDYAADSTYWLGELTKDGVNPAQEFQRRANAIRKQVKAPYKPYHKSTPNPHPPSTSDLSAITGFDF